MRRRFISNKNIYEYLIIEAIGTASFSFPNELQCCKDDVWETYVPNTVYTIELGKKVFIKGNLGSGSQIGTFIINGKCKLSGSCMALVNEGNVNKPTNKFSFKYLFSGCDSIVEVSKNFLPATNLSMSCYEEMFKGCTSLVNAPELPATTLADSCYASMFNGCTSLITAPELPATTLADSCYASMFNGCKSLVNVPSILPATDLTTYCYISMFAACTSLTIAPELPATTLAQSCYYSMFKGCTKLNYIKMLATDISARTCLYFWVSGVASSGTFVKNPAMTSLPTGTSGIPSGWSVQNA